MDNTEITHRRQNRSMTIPEPQAPSDAPPPHARPYRPFTVNGPYGAHRIYSYRGPWMPPIDYGANLRHARYVDLLNYFQGFILPFLAIPLANAVLSVRNTLVEIPEARNLGKLGASLLPVIELVAKHHANPGVWQTAMTVNMLVMTAFTTIVIILWGRAFRREGYSDLSITLYSRQWRHLNRRTRPLSACKRVFYGTNLVYGSILVLFGSTVSGLWAAPSSLFYTHFMDFGIFDGRIFTHLQPNMPGVVVRMTQAEHSLNALRYLMVGQDFFIWMILFGLFYVALWPLRRAAYRNDLAYILARAEWGIDLPDTASSHVINRE